MFTLHAGNVRHLAKKILPALLKRRDTATVRYTNIGTLFHSVKKAIFVLKCLIKMKRLI